MKVLYFHQHFTTPKGAAGTRSYEMAQRLIAKGHQVTMVCGSHGLGETGLKSRFQGNRRRGQVDGIDVIEFNMAYSNNDRFIKRTWTFIRFALSSIKVALEEDYDILFATTTPLTAGIPGIVARWFRGKPFIFEVRDLWPKLPKAMGVITNPMILWAMDVLEWVSYHSANRLIGLSPGIVDGILERGIAKNRVIMIPNGCDLNIFNQTKTPPWRPTEVKETDLMAVFTGTHGLANGLDAVLDAALELKKRGRDDIKLVLVGSGKCKNDLQRRAKKQKLKNVIFHDPVSKLHLAGLMANTDIGMQILSNVPAFYYGTSPNKFFDYLSSGLPILNNYPGWLAEVIIENQCGFVVPPEDPKAFADALETAADHREKLKKMGENSLKLAKEKFNRTILSNQWVDWLILTPSIL